QLLERAYDGLVARANRFKDELASQWAEQAGLWLGECHEQVGNVGRAHTVYSRVVARNSKSIPGRIGVAKTSWTQSRLQDALDQYRVVTRLPRHPQGVWADIARLTMLVNLERVQPNWKEVEDALQDAENQLMKPLPTAVVILKAEYLANRRRIKDGSIDDVR